jgi:hypothetical protein
MCRRPRIACHPPEHIARHPVNTLKIIALLTLVAGLQGCASTSIHGAYMTDSVAKDPRSSMLTPVFPGALTDLALTGMALSAPVTCWFVNDIEWWMFPLAPFPLLDAAPSLLADLLYLPGDITFWRTARLKPLEPTGRTPP